VWHGVCVCVCVCECVFHLMCHAMPKRLGTLTVSLLAFLLCRKTSRSHKFSVRCLRYARRSLFTCPVIRSRNITSGKTSVILYYVPDRTNCLCVTDCAKGVKFRTLHSLFLFPPPPLLLFGFTKGPAFLDFRLLGRYVGIPMLALSVVWEPLSLDNAGLIPWRYIVLPPDVVKNDGTLC
jgi:hypothetical protein